jgi:hypothetical protein
MGVKRGLELMLKRRLRVFENRVLRKVFESRGGEGNGRVEKTAQ